MTYTAPDHYSYKFKFDIEKLPAIRKDRISCGLSVVGIICGFIFIALGGFELFSLLLQTPEINYDFNLPQSVSSQNLLIQRYTFDTIIALMGIAIITISILSLMRYKEIFFDGDHVKITHKPLFGDCKEEVEELYNYIGVLLRVEYYQLGLISRNRYIIELYHRDKNKRIPLYISTSSRNVRKIWEYYSEKLKMPALFMTDHGLISRHHTELSKTLKDMAQKWHLNSLYHNDEDMPSSVKYTVKKNKVIVKEKKLFFDIYSILAAVGIFILTSLLIYAGINYDVILPYTGIWGFSFAVAFCLSIIGFSLLVIFSKDVLIITDYDIILGHNLLFVRRNADFLPKHKIAAVDVGHNPTTDRYYLSVITNDKTIVFGKNMPIDDLRWVRGFIIREIVK